MVNGSAKRVCPCRTSHTPARLGVDLKNSNRATAGSVKDAGDDPDVTHGALVLATVRRAAAGSGIAFRAGPGVGTVTKAGLPLPIGEPAINRDDFPMLLEALRAGGKPAVAKVLPRPLIESTTACGTPDEVLARVVRYRRAGVTFPLIRAQARHQSARALQLFAKR